MEAIGPLGLTLIMTSLITCLTYTNVSEACPVECTCNADLVVCTNVSALPDLSNRSMVRKLIIRNHKIPSLRKGDFKGFTKLLQLEITNGTMTSLEAGAFDDVNETIEEMSLIHNQIEGLIAGVFVNIKNMRKLTLRHNRINIIRTGTFVNLLRLNTLYLGWNKLQKLENNSFVGVPDLTTLYLVFNNLKVIPFNALQGCNNLTDLYLTTNDIASAQDGTTSVRLPSLEVLELDNNPLLTVKSAFPNIGDRFVELNLGFSGIRTFDHTVWSNLGGLKRLVLNGIHVDHLVSGMFHGLTSLDTLLLMFMHDLISIGPDAFSGLDSLRNIDLSHSEFLLVIEETAFMSTKNLTHLYLNNCSLSYIPANLVAWSTLIGLNVTNNPIHCDCKNSWMLDDDIFGNNTYVKNEIQNLKCASPKKHRGQSIGSLKMQQLCEAESSYFTTGVIIIVVCLVLVSIITYIIKKRSHIYMWCHRYFMYRRYTNDMVFTVNRDNSIAELEDTVETRPLAVMRLETEPL
ncbi:slit homolog 1 protein-like [Mya arenaria]|uniref:slit homolog 1 protein-like n=1 Tax=Mya arenaria TaxID=6604 RepID=UPI0022E4D433|nr:slit homolog 1 protein-like [Mya arenaria]XP_052782633.1 slit homolog 1 protein-like [Mya arenaria]XP_052782634.1 slit homolog 1 protein-like [Mya arenaria]XP_052782636.1 slit homolog 1 protein-like [Mya arenaria]XP_052782637.1 slit homolog 1 protein-like [Mya arenaria]XP_052782638.1 slit homolog 1 protein-like [Mya arenaria]XP_052782639.1 slit homolog 1 protein-like [Mya arenaria]XP_052782640.1 slit homolog 1 protein-like [Mya arenaria]XP_052782641.1 slit homolog 1 protein-like [Mya are